MVSKNPKTPNLSPMADDAITRGGIEVLESLVYIYVYCCDTATTVDFTSFRDDIIKYFIQDSFVKIRNRVYKLGVGRNTFELIPRNSRCC